MSDIIIIITKYTMAGKWSIMINGVSRSYNIIIALYAFDIVFGWFVLSSTGPSFPPTHLIPQTTVTPSVSIETGTPSAWSSDQMCRLNAR